MQPAIIRRPHATIMWVALGLSFTSLVSAAPILIQDERSVRSTGNVNSSTATDTWTREERVPTGFGVFNASASNSGSAGTNSASSSSLLQSAVSVETLSARGEASSSAVMNEGGSSYYSSSVASGSATTTFRVTFQVLEPTQFDLAALLSFDTSGGSSYCCSNSDGVTFSLRNGGYSNYPYPPYPSSQPQFNLSLGSSSSTSDFTQNVQLSGILDPNTYVLEAIATSSSNRDGWYYYPQFGEENSLAVFDFTFTMNPVPAPPSFLLMLTGFMFAAGKPIWARLRKH